MQRQLLNHRSLAVLGVASGLGQPKPGLELGPTALRATGILGEFRNLGWNTLDLGDLSPSDSGDAGAWDVITRTQNACHAAMSRNTRMMLLGGDHSVSVGSIRAALSVYPDLRVIWVDAHGNMNTPKTSETGNLHGMPLASLLGLFGTQACDPVLSPENLFLVGVRSLDPPEAQLIEQLGIKIATAAQVKEIGTARVLAGWGLLNRGRPTHLSFDIDALDPLDAPATGIQVSGGLALDEARLLCSLIAKSDTLVSMDMVELNPLQASNSAELERTLTTARDLMASAWCPAPLLARPTGATLG